jgi:flagellar motor switch protein FliG
MASSVASKSGPSVGALKGPDKAAALLLCMGKPLASRLLMQFDTDELKQITRSIAQLGTVPVPMLEALVEEFASQFANGVDLLGSPDEVQEMLDGVLPLEQIADVMPDLTGNSNQGMWDRLSNVPESVFAGFLDKEHPQTAAFIVSKITPVCAAKFIGRLPRELRDEIMRRMLSIAPVTESAVRINGRRHAELDRCASQDRRDFVQTHVYLR